MRIKTIIILILIIAAFGAGIYFKDDAIRLFAGFSASVQNFKKLDIQNLISEAEKKIFLPPPLNIGGLGNQVVLLQSKIISETNLQRQENGNLPALTENQTLNEVASAKAADLFLNQYFEHVSPSGVGPGELAQSYGYDYIMEGENLILGNFSSEKEVVQDWMNSAGHRANILNNRYTEIGAAVVKGTYKGQIVWIGVQEFGLPSSFCERPSEAFKNEIDSNKTQLDFLTSQLDAKKQQLEASGRGSPGYNQMVNDYNQLVQDYNSLAQTTKNFVVQYNERVNSFNNCVAGK
ncbi:MAG: CAP domain-containing protein [Candidatus Staskawiczbacteria bacterium]|nr:CAP domain-containing protein [Candidatus Staskawiczbacteria bacterium]